MKTFAKARPIGSQSVADPFADHPIDWTLKGVAANWEGVAPAAIGASRLNLFDDALLFPTAILKRSALDSNRAWMRRFLALTNAKIAPHGKTTLSPTLFRMQIEDGAWGVTAATAHHARIYRRAGVQRIFLANQLVGAGNIRWVLDELAEDPAFDFYCLADSVAGVDQLTAACRDHGGATLKILVEMGRHGGRGGVRTVAEGVAVAEAIARAAPHLQLAGVETFEGISQASADAVDVALGLLDGMVELSETLDASGLLPDEVLLSAGGSGFFDLAAKAMASVRLRGRAEIVLRSGCYITHDDGLYADLLKDLQARQPDVAALGGGLQGALQVWGHVLSLPEPGQVICGLGRRDVGSDARMPQALWWGRPPERAVRDAPGNLVVEALFDQHAVLRGDADHGLQVGDLLGFGVSHPCTTFDRWRALLVVDDDYTVDGLIRTYF